MKRIAFTFVDPEMEDHYEVTLEPQENNPHRPWLVCVEETRGGVLMGSILLTNQGALKLADALRRYVEDTDVNTSPYLTNPPLTTREREVRYALRQVTGHLKAALAQAVPTDDQIIMGHVRDADRLLDGALAKLERGQ